MGGGGIWLAVLCLWEKAVDCVIKVLSRLLIGMIEESLYVREIRQACICRTLHVFIQHDIIQTQAMRFPHMPELY